MNTFKRLALALLLIAGCSAPPVTGDLRHTESRSRQLLSMAAAEAAEIKEVDPRLTRQLNLAEAQINRGWRDDAHKTLAAARSTLTSSDAANLNDHARISGWVAISELSREVGDKDTAAVAIDGAVAEMNKLPDPAKRCEYVMGIANELQYIKGKPAAAKMLEQAGPWTKSIDNVQTRRQAVVAFASALFNLDQYPAGQAMIRQEGDAGWRSDVLAKLAMAQPRFAQDKPVAARAALAQPGALEMRLERDEGQLQTTFGKSLQYRSVFQNQTQSNTSK